MTRFLRIAALCALAALLIVLSTDSVIRLFGSASTVRIIVCLVILAGFIILLRYDLLSHALKRECSKRASFATSLQTFLGALVRFSAGNLTVNIPETIKLHNAVKNVSAELDEVFNLIDQNIDEFNAVTAVPLKRLCFTGDNSYQEGLIMGEKIHQFMGNKGVLAIVIPAHTQVLHSLRAKGCISYFQQNKTQIEILPIAEGSGNGEITVQVVEKLFEKHPDIDNIYFTDGVTPVFVESWLRRNNYAGKVSLYAHDITAENIELLERGMLNCLLAENFYAETYNAVMYLYNSLESGWSPVSYKLYLDPLVITRENYEVYWDKVTNDRILTDREQAILAEPVPNKTNTKWHFAFVLPTAGTFFVMGTKGAEDARDKLATMGVRVDIIDTFEDWDTFATKAAMAPHILDCRTRGVQGICTAVFDRQLVPVINEVADSGIRITTFNSEPLNLRDIILNVSTNMRTIQESSTDLAASAEESARANTQIVKVITAIEEGTSQQNKMLENAEENFIALSRVIQDVSSIVDNYTQAVENINSETVKGARQVSETAASFSELRESLQTIDRQLNQLQADIGRINKIISTIDTFSTDTNVLAINASIQAARAGEQGKGFAVVAKEIRSLSEKSTQATEEIAHIISSVLGSVRQVVATSSNNLTMMEQNADRLSHADSAFQVISNHINESSESIRSIDSSIGTVSNSSQSLKDAMINVFDMNKQSLESIQELSESLRQLSAQSEELSTMAGRYKDLADSQEMVISQLTF
ncbi:MAG: substrate-binding domain-containing protein [Spirochaetales bacterium]|nr:substrate-binding domain-containing protein [Spirochaetales bacterium]